MTFSIVARCPRTGQVGVAAATAMPAVGKLLTHAVAGVGAVATQARINPYLGIDGVRLLGEGLSPQAVLQRLESEDPRFDLRQVAVVDALGHAAAWTGEGCPHWAGHLLGDGFSAQGNRIAGRAVLEATAERFKELTARPLAERLMEALVAGDSQGGDTKGERSATIFIMDDQEYPLWDIRVDEHERPLDELRRLYDVFANELVPQIKRMPTRQNPAGEPGEESA